jgi:phage terminase large subunit-like protein
LIEATRVRAVPDLQRVVVAVDPAVTSRGDADETGIIVAGRDARPQPHGYVLADLSGHHAPIDWARAAIAAYHTHKADRIVAEVNNGGDMVEATLRAVDLNVPFLAVHASRGKVVRAEPVAALYEQSRVHHLGCFPQLEDQMAEFASDLDRTARERSPDRVDALVWAFTDLLLQEMKGWGAYELARRQAEAVRSAKEAAKPAKPVYYAPGSVEWQRQQQERAGAS